MTATTTPSDTVVVLDPATWRARRDAHRATIDRWLAEHLERRQHGRKHPVEDFLFTYYSYRPGQLRRWHPGAGVLLVDADPAEFGRDYRAVDGGVMVDTSAILQRREESVRWIRTLLANTAARRPHLACFNLHEWAMVYRQRPEELRHAGWPLRLGPEGSAQVVEELGVRCTHFDAYRFFTPEARPLNQRCLTREGQLDNEQPGCLHANMDLYKFAYKLSPLIPSELLAETFALAREIRALDMRASPYDLSALGYTPVRIETPEGRAEYVAAQREFARRAALLRARLIEAIDRALALAGR
ncbi:MAG TPA: 3-methyladenine DNA glycosylase [Micromonospora sp.]